MLHFGGVPGARGRNEHFLRFSNAGTRNIQCFRPSGARKNIAFEAIKHCKFNVVLLPKQQNTVNYRVLLLPRRILRVLGGPGGPPGTPRRPLALQGRSRGPLGPLLGAFLGPPGALLAALGALPAALGALLAALGALLALAQEAPEGSQKGIPGGPTSNKNGPAGIRTRDLRQYTLASPLS